MDIVVKSWIYDTISPDM
jgi:hypothetical protein